MFSSYLINIRDHWSFHHCFDASTLYSKPRNYQCLYHLQRIKDKNSRLVSLQQKEQEAEKTKPHSHLIPVPQAQRCSRTVSSTVFYHPANSGRRRRRKKWINVFCCVYLVFGCLFWNQAQKSYKASLWITWEYSTIVSWTTGCICEVNATSET